MKDEYFQESLHNVGIEDSFWKGFKSNINKTFKITCLIGTGICVYDGVQAEKSVDYLRKSVVENDIKKYNENIKKAIDLVDSTVIYKHIIKNDLNDLLKK